MMRPSFTLSSGLLAAGLSFAGMASAADPEMIVFDWAGFEEESLIADYVAKHGQMPTYALFGDDDEAFQKVSSGFKTDVVHPCSAMIPKYRDAGLIEPWDTSRIPEFTSINPNFLKSKAFVDDEGVWFIPTYFGYTAIAWNTAEVPPEDVASLEVFRNPKYAGRVSLPDNTDDVWSLALLATGVSDWTNLTEEQFQAAAAWLREAHANVRAYWADPSELSQLMASGEVLVSWSWNDGVALMKQEGLPIAFQREAKEGAATYFCGYVNTKDSPGSEDKAYDFINAWISQPSAKALVEAFGYGHSNMAGMAAIPAQELVDANLSPVESILIAQTPKSPEMRDRMVEEFEMIKSGF